MRFKFLVPLILAGASSVAMASDRPYGYQVNPDYSGYSVQTFAYGANPEQARIARREWMQFASHVSLRDRAATVFLGGRSLSAIQLQATYGGAWIDTVLVDLEDGRRLTIQPSRPLDVQQAPNLRIDLGRGLDCGVRSVTIIGQERGRAAFRVIGA